MSETSTLIKPAATSTYPEDWFAGRVTDDTQYRYAEVLALTGVRGSGKTALATYLVVRYGLAYGRRVLSNYPIKGPIRRHGKIHVVQAEPLTYAQLLTLDEGFNNVIIVIDELPVWFNSHRHQSKGSELFGLFMQQIRKRGVTVVYTNQNLQWGDNRLRFQTDLEVQCFDMYYTPRGRGAGLKAGQKVRYTSLDLTGRYSGRSFFQSHEPAGAGYFYPEQIWPYYDTSQIVDPWEAMLKVEINRPKMVIGFGGQEQDEEPLPLAPDAPAESPLLKHFYKPRGKGG